MVKVIQTGLGIICIGLIINGRFHRSFHLFEILHAFPLRLASLRFAPFCIHITDVCVIRFISLCSSLTVFCVFFFSFSLYVHQEQALHRLKMTENDPCTTCDTYVNSVFYICDTFCFSTSCLHCLPAKTYAYTIHTMPKRTEEYLLFAFVSVLFVESLVCGFVQRYAFFLLHFSTK